MRTLLFRVTVLMGAGTLLLGVMWPSGGTKIRSLSGWLRLAASGIAFGALSLSTLLGVGLLIWGYWIGDNEHWIYSVLPYLATSVGIGVGALVWVRARNVRAPVAYCVCVILGSLGSLGAFGTERTHDTLNRIAGFDPETAALSVFQPYTPPEEGPLRLVGIHDTSNTGGRTCLSYVVLRGQAPRGRVTVCKRMWWWTVGSYERFQPRKSTSSAPGDE